MQHVNVPVPSPKKDEVLLKLEAISLNPVDWKIQKGMLRPFMPRKLPYIPGESILPMLLIFDVLQPWYGFCGHFSYSVCNLPKQNGLICVLLKFWSILCFTSISTQLNLGPLSLPESRHLTCSAVLWQFREALSCSMLSLIW